MGKMLQKCHIYTDGSCEPNPGTGGYGGVYLYGMESTLESFCEGPFPETTNNRMELMAAIYALENVRPDYNIFLYTDSKYLVNGMNIWINGWRRSNYKNSKVKNSDLWKRLDELVKNANVNIEFRWVKGHDTNQHNNAADALANNGRMRKKDDN